jgi:hydroxylamine reductase
MTTNCIQKPTESYKDNIFTTGLVGWPGVQHIADKDFAPVIDKAWRCPVSQKTPPAKRSWSVLPAMRSWGLPPR